MRKDKLIIIVFLLFLIGPTIIYWFVKDKMDNNNYEQRSIYNKPAFEVNSIINYPKDYENYYNDHLAFKNEIRKIRAKFYKEVFNTGSTPRVIIGKDDWLFYNGIVNGDGDPISDYRKVDLFSDKEKDNIKEHLLFEEEELKKKGIKFYFFVVPNKGTIYSDKLEGIISHTDRDYTRVEDLINYLKENTDLNIIYPKEVLLKGRESYDTYSKYDTHWNMYGAYLSTEELLKRINKNYKHKEIEVTFEPYGGDLKTMNLIDVENVEPVVKNYYDNVNPTCKEKGRLNECEVTKPLYKSTLLFVGDSFREIPQKYISKLYSKTIFVHRNDYKESLLEDYKPDIVVFETAERYVPKITKMVLINK